MQLRSSFLCAWKRHFCRVVPWCWLSRRTPPSYSPALWAWLGFWLAGLLGGSATWVSSSGCLSQAHGEEKQVISAQPGSGLLGSWEWRLCRHHVMSDGPWPFSCAEPHLQKCTCGPFFFGALVSAHWGISLELRLLPVFRGLSVPMLLVVLRRKPTESPRVAKNSGQSWHLVVFLRRLPLAVQSLGICEGGR